jgi:hypothetical protein
MRLRDTNYLLVWLPQINPAPTRIANQFHLIDKLHASQNFCHLARRVIRTFFSYEIFYLMVARAKVLDRDTLHTRHSAER